MCSTYSDFHDIAKHVHLTDKLSNLNYFNRICNYNKFQFWNETSFRIEKKISKYLVGYTGWFYCLVLVLYGVLSWILLLINFVLRQVCDLLCFVKSYKIALSFKITQVNFKKLYQLLQNFALLTFYETIVLCRKMLPCEWNAELKKTFLRCFLWYKSGFLIRFWNSN